MNEFMTFDGSEDTISKQITQKIGLSEDDSYRILYFLVNNQDVLSSDESIAVSANGNTFPGMGMTFASEKYHISIKTTTIIMCAFLLDIALTQGAASAILSLSGMPTKAFAKLSGQEGEKCVLRETLKSKNKTGNVHILDKFNGHCINNDILNCKYRNGINCNCHPQQIEEIFKELVNSNVFTKDSYGNYHYCW